MNELERIVVLIDADNTRLSKMADVLREISTHGRIVVKRAYGNWRKEALKHWEAEIKRLAIKAVQQFDYVSGKNATDMALVIDTIELLYTKTYDAFVIVSSDSDYTPLAIKLHESGVYVMGVGEKQTAESFRNACDEFLFLENISTAAEAEAEAEPEPEPEPPAKSAGKKAAAGGRAAASGGQKAARTAAAEPSKGGRGGRRKSAADGLEEVHALLRKAFDTYQDDDGYVSVSTAGSFLKRTKPDFDSRTYGHTKLSQLLEAFPQKYELKRRQKGSGAIISYRCLGGR